MTTFSRIWTTTLVVTTSSLALAAVLAFCLLV